MSELFFSVEKEKKVHCCSMRKIEDIDVTFFWGKSFEKDANIL